MIGLQSRPRHGKDVVVRQGETELMLLNASTGQYYTLDDVGITIWSLCDGTRTVSQIIEAITQEYDADASTVETDVLALLGELEHEELALTD